MYVVKELTRTCDSCPSQWEGTTAKGESVYIRYRWGELDVEIGGESVVSMSPSDSHGMDGVMSDEKLFKILSGILVVTQEGEEE